MTVRRAFKELKVTNPLIQRGNGEAAIEYLRSVPDDAPCLIMLDLNMPVMNGIELLQAVKQHPLWRRIPAVVLTTSEEEQDKIASFDLSVAGYMKKPVDYRQFVEAMRTIDAYWTLSEVPAV
ncbi:MAG: response regulator [Burkholderiaceae bacterium]|nr:response regulator [Burkholderiaceae bacterium]